MKIVYGQKLNNEQIQTVNEIALNCGVMFDTARLLFYRKQDTVKKAKHFLNPNKSGFNNPFLLRDMDKAVQKINDAKLLNQSVLIFGDYDADGVCATTILYNCLKDFGLQKVQAFVPERENGYGLSVDTVKDFISQSGLDLLITVDCGISDYEIIKDIKALGVDVIVTDHHEPPEILPDCTKINPKIANQDYPFDSLCGAGVAYKLGYALIGEKADAYLDFVALATVADSMDLVDENRDIVAEGLKLFNNQKTMRPCMKYLIGDNMKTITAQTLAYVVAPRINAGGRMGDANCALQLFIEKDPNKIFDLAVKLNTYNTQRQVMCDEIYREAKEKIQKYSLHKHTAILVKDQKWQAGFIGIVAARLVEEYGKPVIVFAGQDDFLKGSARSVDAINIHEAINANKDYLIGFGGHSQAAGVSISKENFLAFDKAINQYIKEQYANVDTTQKLYVEWEVNDKFSSAFAREISLLEPFGVGNKSPLFATKVNYVDALPLKENSPHYYFKTSAVDMLNFNGQKDVETLSLPIDKKVVFETNLSVFKGKEYLKGYVKAVCVDYTDMSSLTLNAFDVQLDTLLKVDGEFEYIDKSQIESKGGYGTLYVISDEKNLKNYPQLNGLNKSFLKPENKNLINEIVYAPKEILEGYERVIYLDRPIFVQVSSAKNYVVKDYIGYKILDKISTDRTDFAQIFTYLKTLNNKEIKNLIAFVKSNCGEFSKEQFLFALKVFIELKIFVIRNGRLTYDEKIKKALTNSKLYSKIVSIKDSYV